MKIHHYKSGGCDTGLYSFVLIGTLCIMMSIASCNKDEQPVEMDEESVYNIELQAGFTGTFNSLLLSLDTFQAADSVLKLLLHDPHVISGEVSEQAIFIDYRDGTVGGIFFDPQDSPEIELPFPKKISLGTGIKTSNVMPSSKRSILIDPHYFERVEFTTSLLEVYDKLFPGIGYDPPERYFNDACTLDLFTKLEDFGFIHIYAHGIKHKNSVYLMTGESPNVISHNTYKQDRLEKGLIVVTHADDSLTRYYIDPTFIADKNDFTINKPLVFGGFCYSFLGGWPEIVTSDGASGYFGFDWSVLTTRSTNWAKDLLFYLTDYSVDKPYSASWWIYSSPVEKTYWDSDDKKNVSIDYEGADDLVLWDWEGLGFDFTSFNLSIQVDASFEDSDGNLSNEVWSVPLSPGLGHNISFNGNKFTSSWHNELFFDRSRSGNVEIVLRPNGKEIDYLSLKDTLTVSTGPEIYIYNIQLRSIPLASADATGTFFEITGPNACNSIEKLAYRKLFLSGYTEKWKMMTTYECASAEAKVLVVMRK